jgi:mRNA interferase MazF
MATFIKGDVVVVPFPFSDLTNAKRRPALVIANLTGNDVILCQITSKNLSDSYSITITENDFSSGSLNQTSNIRPNKLFTADAKIIIYKIGQLKSGKMQEITKKIISILES